MPDSVPAAAAAQLDDPFAELRGPLAGTVRMRLEGVGNTERTPHMQRLRLTATLSLESSQLTRAEP
jgi:hypothetical protein